MPVQSQPGEGNEAAVVQDPGQLGEGLLRAVAPDDRKRRPCRQSRKEGGGDGPASRKPRAGKDAGQEPGSDHPPDDDGCKAAWICVEPASEYAIVKGKGSTGDKSQYPAI
jgi:hypothetical protein